jgi:hypothetical protein
MSSILVLQGCLCKSLLLVSLHVTTSRIEEKLWPWWSSNPNLSPKLTPPSMPASWATFTTTMAASPAPPQFLITSPHLKFFTCFMLCGMMVFENHSSSKGDALATFITLEVDFSSLHCDLHFSILLWGSATLSLTQKRKSKQVISGSRITLNLEMHCKRRSKVCSFCQCFVICNSQL